LLFLFEKQIIKQGFTNEKTESTNIPEKVETTKKLRDKGTKELRDYNNEGLNDKRTKRLFASRMSNLLIKPLKTHLKH
jgi:hypothetical protein